MKNQKGISSLIGIIVIVVVAVIAFGGVFAYQYYSMPKEVIKNPVIEIPKTETTKDQTADSPVQSQQATEGWKTYTNNQYGFEIKYPSNFTARESKTNNSDNVYWNLYISNDKGFLVSISIVNTNTFKNSFSYRGSQNAPEEENIIGGISGRKVNQHFKYLGFDLYNFAFFNKGDLTYSFTYGGDNIPYINSDIYNQTISTFKFTPVK